MDFPNFDSMINEATSNAAEAGKKAGDAVQGAAGEAGKMAEAAANESKLII